MEPGSGKRRKVLLNDMIHKMSIFFLYKNDGKEMCLEITLERKKRCLLIPCFYPEKYGVGQNKLSALWRM